MSSFCWRISSCFKSSLFTTIWHSGQSLYSFSKYLSNAVTSVSKLAYVHQIDKLCYLAIYTSITCIQSTGSYTFFLWIFAKSNNNPQFSFHMKHKNCKKYYIYNIFFSFTREFTLENIINLDIIYFYLISTIGNWFRESCYCYFKQEKHTFQSKDFLCASPERWLTLWYKAKRSI